MIIHVISLRYAYNGNDKNNTSFNQIRLQMAEISIIKTAET